MWKSLVLLLVLLPLSPFSYSAFSEEKPEVTYLMTEAEMMQLERIFEGLSTQNTTLQENLTKLQGSFETVMKQSDELKTDLKEVRTSLMKAELSLTKYADDVAAARRTAILKTVLYTAGGFLVGGAVGYAFGAF